MKKITLKLVCLCLLGSIFNNASVLGQNNLNKKKDKQHKDLFIRPTIFYTPETNLAFGGIGIYPFRFKKETPTTRPSQVTLLAAYTLNKQVIFSLPYQLFVRKQQYNFYGKLSYNLSNLNFYGIGNDTKSSDEEVYKVSYPSMSINALKLLSPNFYGGFRFSLDNFDIKEIEEEGLLDSEAIIGQAGGVSTSGGLVLNFDNRNNIFFPTKGSKLELVGSSSGSYIGSDFDFTKLTLDASTFIGFKNQVLAINLYGEFTGGAAPFNQLALFGGANRMRGYFEGRLRDKHQFVLQSEYRFPIYKHIFRGVIFGGIGQVAHQIVDFNLNNLKYTIGGGLRVLINPRERIYFRLDAGFGKGTSGYYVTIGEAF